MTTLGTVIARGKRRVLSGQREIVNKLASSYTAGGTSLSFTYDLGAIQAGAKVEVDNELFHVWTVDSGAKTATVSGAFDGTTAANHDSGDLVYVNPKFPAIEWIDAINDELADLSSPVNGLFQVKTVDLTVSASAYGYNLTSVADLLDVQEVRYDTSGPENEWPLVRGWSLARSMPTTDFASGFGLIMHELIPEPGRTIRVRYRAKFTQLGTSDLTQVVETVSGIHAEAVDILSIGAAIRVTSGREIARNFFEAQGDTRRAEEVGAGANLNATAALRALRAQRIAAEAARLEQQWPKRAH